MNKTDLMLEIGPYVNPLFPKSDGWNIISNDVFSYDELLTKAKRDENLNQDAISRIEFVDYVGEPTSIFNEMDVLDGKVNYIISSHNLEHMPNPIEFLITTQKLLVEGGQILLALPDYRCCWDRFRPLTSCADWLQAYKEKRIKPTPQQILLQNSMHCRWDDSGVLRATMPMGTKVEDLFPLETLDDAYTQYLENFEKGDDLEYIDTHCWTFIPESFKLIMSDLRYLSVINLGIVEVIADKQAEFFVRLEKVNSASFESEDFYPMRKGILRNIAAFYSS